MKSRKNIRIIIILIIGILVAAFTILPKVLATNEKGKAGNSYQQAEMKDNTLILSVDYNSYGDSFEIGRDIVVSTDEEFLNILRNKKVTPNGSLCLYEYEIPSDIVNFDTVYIKPPVLYIPTEIYAVSCKLSEGEVMKTSDGEKDWFRITSVRTAEMTQNTWLVDIEIEAIEGDLPRFPKIEYDGQIIGGVSSLNFDNESNLLSGVFEFKVTAYDGQLVDNMIYSGNLVISEALLRTEAERFPVESNIQSLTVIIK